MYISSIEVSDFRRYRGVNRLTFSPRPGRNIAIVSGANGFGKTSILLALLWCLYGGRLQWLDDGYRRLIKAAGGYTGFCRSMVNRVARQSGEAVMYVEVTFADVMLAGVAVNRISLRRTFNASQDGETVHLVMGPSGTQMVSPESADAFIEDSLIPLEVAAYLLFDAERVASGEGVWGTDTTQLANALSIVAGLRPYEQLIDDLRSVRVRVRRQSAKRAQRAAMDTIEERVAQSKAELAGLSEALAITRDERMRTLQDLDRARRELARAGNVPSRDAMAELERRKQAIEKEGEEIRGSLRPVLEVAPLAIAGGILKRIDGELLTETRKAAPWTVDEITRLTDSAVAEIRGRGALALSDAAVKELSGGLGRLLVEHLVGHGPARNEDHFTVLQDFTVDEKGLIRDALARFREGFRSRLSMSLRAFRLNRREYTRVTRAIAEATRLASDPDIAAFQQQTAVLEAKVGDFDERLQRLNREYGSVCSRVAELDRQGMALAESITVSERHQKVDAVARQLIEELEEFISIRRSHAAQTLSDRLVQVFRTLLHKKGLVAGTSVTAEGSRVSILLRDATGQSIPPETLSRGEQQICSMAVLMALLGMAPEPFPVFLDSPFQRLDEQHIANLISGLATMTECQVVLLPLPGTELSSEVCMSLSDVTSDIYVIEDQGEWSKIAREDSLMEVAHR